MVVLELELAVLAEKNGGAMSGIENISLQNVVLSPWFLGSYCNELNALQIKIHLVLLHIVALISLCCSFILPSFF
jgi:hypothetical protein